MITGQEPDQLVTTVYKSIIHQIPQTSEMDQYASDVESKATWEANAEGKYSATIAEATTMTQKHAGSSMTIHRAQPTVN